MLLRHAIQRPPVSLAIFNLSDVKQIDLFVQDNLFKYFDMYVYTLTERTVLLLKTVPVFDDVEAPAVENLTQGAVEMPARDIDDIYEYLTEGEKAEFER